MMAGAYKFRLQLRLYKDFLHNVVENSWFGFIYFCIFVGCTSVVPGLSRGKERPEIDAGASHPSSAVVKKE